MPAWSPDGRTIAFVRASAPAARAAWIYRADASGGREEALTQGPFDFAPAWSPDGSTVAYAHGPTGGYAGQLSLDALAAPRDVGTGVFAMDVAWSPDGRRIACVAAVLGGGKTCYRHVNVGRRLLGLDPVRPHAPRRCLPNGDLYVVDANGWTGLTRLTATTADERHPSWSPDGRLVFSAGGRLFTIDARGGQPHLLYAPRRGRAVDPAWSAA